MCSSPKIPKSSADDRKPILETLRDGTGAAGGARKNPLRIDMNSAQQASRAGSSASASLGIGSTNTLGLGRNPLVGGPRALANAGLRIK